MTFSIRALTGSAMAAAMLLGASAPANAVLATSIRIKSALPDYLQIGELQVFAGGVNIALASNGATVSGSGGYMGSSPDTAIDGIISTIYPDIYHSDGDGSTERLLVTFAQAYDISDIVIYGRSDYGSNLNLFTYELFLWGQQGDMLVGEGLLDARNAPYSASVSLPTTPVPTDPTTPAVPEPASWAMMIGGLGLAGGALRARRSRVRVAAA